MYVNVTCELSYVIINEQLSVGGLPLCTTFLVGSVVVITDSFNLLACVQSRWWAWFLPVVKHTFSLRIA